MTKHQPKNVDAAARLLADWINYSWDGMREGRIGDRGFKQWAFNGIGTLNYQGGKQDLRDLAVQIGTTLNGEAVRGSDK